MIHCVKAFGVHTAHPSVQGAQPELVLAKPLRQSEQVRVWLPLLAVTRRALAQLFTTVPKEARELSVDRMQVLLLTEST